MKENPFFKEYEFECRCGKCQMPKNVPSNELVTILVEIREHFGKCVRINSGYRCAEHNARVGGAKNSQHTIGSAADFVVFGVPTEEVFAYVLQRYGERPLGIALKRNLRNPMGGFVHIDTRGTKAMWDYPPST